MSVSVVQKVTAPQIQSVFSEYLGLVYSTAFLNPDEKIFVQNLNLDTHSGFIQELSNIINSVLTNGIVLIEKLPRIVLSTHSLLEKEFQKNTLADIHEIPILTFLLTCLLHTNLIPAPPYQLRNAQTILEDSIALLETTVMV